MRFLRYLVMLCAVLFAIPAAAQHQPGAPLVIATHEAPPFAMKRPDGQWQGLAIDLWRGIAHDQNLNFRFQETSL
jgi:polar amino acid transport system substrate-binding protein